MKDELLDIRDVYNFMMEKNIIISFLGDFNHRVVTSILSSVKKILDDTEMEFLARKRLYNVIMESLDNVSRHSHDFAEKQHKRYSVSTVFTVSKGEEGFTVLTGNFVSNEQIPVIQEKIERVNALDKEGLQQMYRERLLSSDENGGGLGIIDISLRSGARLSYHFKPAGDDVSFFIMQTTVSK